MLPEPEIDAERARLERALAEASMNQKVQKLKAVSGSPKSSGST